MMKLGGTAAVRVSAGVAAPFAIVDIAMSWDQEGPVQATVTGVGGAAAGIYTSIAIGGVIGGVPGAIVGGIIGGFTTLGAGKIFDGIWDYGEDVIKDIKYDLANKNLEINTSITNMQDMQTVLQPVFLEGQADTTVLSGGITVNVMDGEVITDTYTVQTGDTVWDIAQQSGKTVDEIIAANPWLADRCNDDKSFILIKPGEEINIDGANGTTTVSFKQGGEMDLSTDSSTSAATQELAEIASNTLASVSNSISKINVQNPIDSFVFDKANQAAKLTCQAEITVNNQTIRTLDNNADIIFKFNPIGAFYEAGNRSD